MRETCNKRKALVVKGAIKQIQLKATCKKFRHIIDLSHAVDDKKKNWRMENSLWCRHIQRGTTELIKELIKEAFSSVIFLKT